MKTAVGMRTVKEKIRALLSGREHRMVLGLFALVLMTVPLLVGPYAVIVMVDVGLYSIVTMGLILLMGFAGQISLGQGVFFGLGAYMSGIITTRCGLSPWLVLLVAAVAAGAVAIVVGRALVRLRGLIVAGVTLALNLVFCSLVVSLRDLTGGATGLPLIPRLPLGGFAPSNTLFSYYVVWIVAILLLVFSLNLVNSRTGRALKSVNLLAGGSEDTAQVLGVDIIRYKVQVFAVGAIYASIAGSLYAHYTGCIEPGAFGVHFSVLVAIMAIIGGMTSPWGAFLGAGLIVSVNEALREVMPAVVGGSTGAYELIAYGSILVATLLFLPQGLMSIWRRLQPQERFR